MVAANDPQPRYRGGSQYGQSLYALRNNQFGSVPRRRHEKTGQAVRGRHSRIRKGRTTRSVLIDDALQKIGKVHRTNGSKDNPGSLEATWS